MTAVIGLAIALAISPPSPRGGTIVGDLGTGAFTLSDLRIESRPDQGDVIRGWLCRRRPAPAIRQLSVLARSGDGEPIWSGVVAAPRFDPGRARQCRALRIDLPPDIASNTAQWTLRQR